MKFVKERVNVICQELARLSISQKIKITDMQVKNGCYITPAEADASEEPWSAFDTVTGMAFTTVDELLNYVKENSL